MRSKSPGVPSERGGVAGEVDDPGRPELGQRLERSLGEAHPRRVEQDKIGSRLHHGAQRFFCIALDHTHSFECGDLQVRPQISHRPSRRLDGIDSLETARQGKGEKAGARMKFKRPAAMTDRSQYGLVKLIAEKQVPLDEGSRGNAHGI